MEAVKDIKTFDDKFYFKTVINTFRFSTVLKRTSFTEIFNNIDKKITIVTIQNNF